MKDIISIKNYKKSKKKNTEVVTDNKIIDALVMLSSEVEYVDAIWCSECYQLYSVFYVDISCPKCGGFVIPLETDNDLHHLFSTEVPPKLLYYSML